LSLRLRFLLDTNIIIPLQDSFIALEPSLANFVRLAGTGGHQLLYHPASEIDIRRDSDVARRNRTLTRLKQYSVLQDGPPCPWNTPGTSPNDACDNEILYALERDAIHALVTEDQKLHSKAKTRGLSHRVYFIQSAEDWLQRLHVPAEIRLPHIVDVELHTLTTELTHQFFDSLRAGYQDFDRWFRSKAQEGRRAWIYRSEGGDVAAICIYTVQHNERITDDGQFLTGDALKLCTFKVGESVRGRKIGELFLRAAFRYGSDHKCEAIFLHANPTRHSHLSALLDDFGFFDIGAYSEDRVYVKKHPVAAPPDLQISAFDYVKNFYPHYVSGANIQKFLVPIQPRYHDILFPDYGDPGASLPANHPRTHVGNAIKLAYLSHAPINRVREGDIVLFYRTHDLKAVTTLAVVERFEVLNSPADIASLVSRRTVYSDQEIVELARQPTKVMLFRLIEHFPTEVPYSQLRRQHVIRGHIQSIQAITDESFSRVLRAAGR
jgi:GNAT superfamily N-acetyltransferase